MAVDEETGGSRASARRLGRRAVREPAARCFLLDLAAGRLSISPERALPALEELAKADAQWVVSLLHCGDPSASAVAAAALGGEGSAFHRHLIAAAEDSSRTTRLAGVAGLAEAASVGCEKAVDALAARLKDPDGQVRWAAAAGLGRARRGRCAEKAGKWLHYAIEQGEERALCGAAFGAARLWFARKRDAASLLVKMANNGTYGKRAVAAAMSELPAGASDAAVTLCIEAEDADTRALSAAALARWVREDNGSALRNLARLAEDSSETVRAAAAEALLRQAVRVEPVLVDRLSGDPSPLVRAAVAEAIGRRSDQTLAYAVWPLVEDAVPSVRAAAIKALGALGASEVVRAACRDRAPEVRAAAATVLREGSPRDLETLVRMSEDRDVVVVRAAAQTLGRHLGVPRGPAWERLMELACDSAVAPSAAAGVSAALDADPTSSADVFQNWPVGSVPPAVLGQVCRLARSPITAELARTTRRALECGDGLDEALSDLSAAFTAAGRRDVAREVARLADCAGAGSLADMARASTSPASGSSEPLVYLNAIGRAAGAGDRAPRQDTRRRQLARSLAAVQTCLQRDPTSPQWVFAHRIATRWDVLIRAAFDTAGLGSVSGTLKSTHVLAGPESTILVALENSGEIPASEVSVEVADTVVRAPDLPARGSGTVEVPLGVSDPGVRRVRGSVRFRRAEETGTVQFQGTVQALRAGRMETTENPYVVGKPLSPESTMFFGRAAELNYVERALESGENGSVVVLVGQRRTGKTSLMRRLEARLRHRYRPVFVDVQGMLVPDTQTFFQQLAARAAVSGEDVPMLSDGDSYVARNGAGAELVREIAERSERPLVLLLDEFDDLAAKVKSGRVSKEVFPQLRNLIQHTENVSLVLAGTHRLESLAGGYWSFLLNLATYQRVGCLAPEEAKDVLEVPLGRLGIVYEDAAIGRALRLTGCHPYLLQLLGYRLVERCIASGEAAIRAGLVEEVADDVVEQGEIHLRYLSESAGQEGREMLRLLSSCDEGLTPKELGDCAQSDGGEPSGAVKELSNMEIVRQEYGRCSLNIGLLGRWLARAAR